MAITAEQYDYNVADDADYTWVETMLFPVIVPEANIYALLYNSAKPTLGCMAQQVLISGALCDTEAEMLHYYDNQHLPLPERWTNITSPEGLNIKAVKLPREFRLDYVSSDGETEVHVDWVGMMEPFDIHDPKHSPQAGNAADMHADLEIGKKHKAGHIDMTGRATGTLKVRGRTFEVDCFERMDRSWGPRQPMNIPTCYIVSATIDENLAFHMIVAWNPEKPDGQQFTFEMMYASPDAEQYLSPFAKELQGIGIDARLRFVDSAQWRERAETFDFDAMHVFIPMSELPGIELRDAFGSEYANVGGGLAVSGVSNAGVDKLIDMIVRAETREELRVRVSALDRVLRAMRIRVPYWVRPDSWIAYYDYYREPETLPEYSIGIPGIWWADQARYGELRASGAIR